MEMKFLTDRALLIEKTLIIADLHIGIEYELARSGIRIPHQVKKMQKRIEKLLKQTKAKELIVLGDIKHQVPIISKQEEFEIPEFLENLSKKAKLSIVKGNHDGDIESIAPDNVKIYDPSGFRSGDFAFLHGQSWPNKDLLKAKYLIMAHVHPAIEFWTGGIRFSEHVWLKCNVNKDKFEKKLKLPCNLEEAIVMPAFNPIIGGIAFNSEDFQPLGPILKNNVIDWKSSKVFLLDGTDIGTLKKL
jgi:putative SbcD/Mre11-related phosphoesterase